MKSTGIVRKIDELGRIVIPMEIRRSLHIAERDSLEIFVDDDKIVLKKYNLTCINCGEDDINTFIKFGKLTLCKTCMKQLIKENKKEFSK